MIDVKEYITTEDHRVLEVPPVADMCEMIQLKYNRMMKQCEKLWSENERLKAGIYKDEQLVKYANLVKDAERGFPIGEEEYDKIRAFVHKHNEAHGKAATYTYSFLPTSLGTVGTIKCNHCEETMIFRELQ